MKDIHEKERKTRQAEQTLIPSQASILVLCPAGDSDVQLLLGHLRNETPAIVDPGVAHCFMLHVLFS